ncbi:MAG: DsbA family protein [Leptospiraceae bacterium]|nr:DsbA family protein [Leptospiraceae bacterium]MDW8306197.1 DsbA family protein [Leptospiraceae bacterium]
MQTWLLGVSLIGSLSGLFLSAILMAHHLGTPHFQDIVAQTCGMENTGGCHVVNRSGLSRFLGLPIAFWGWQYYMANLLLVIGYLLERKHTVFLKLALYLGFAALAIDALLFLYSFFVLKTLCPLCVYSYIATVLSLVPLFFYVQYHKRTQRGSTMFFQELRSLLAQKITFVLLAVFIISMSLTFLYCHKGESENKAQDFHKVLEQAAQDFLKAYEKEPIVDLGKPATPGRGATQGILTIHEFADPLCPYCSLMGKKLKDFSERNPEKVKIIYRHFPLDKNCNKNLKTQIHPGACELSYALQCAADQNKFYEMHDAIFADQSNWSRNANLAELTSLAEKLGMRPSLFKTCFSSRTAREKVSQDMDHAHRLQVTGTPTLFVNNRRLPTVHNDFLEFFLQKLLEHEAKKKK